MTYYVALPRRPQYALYPSVCLSSDFLETGKTSLGHLIVLLRHSWIYTIGPILRGGREGKSGHARDHWLNNHWNTQGTTYLLPNNKIKRIKMLWRKIFSTCSKLYSNSDGQGLSYLGAQAELVDDVYLQKHLEHNLTSKHVVETAVHKVEVEQAIVVRSSQFRHLTVYHEADKSARLRGLVDTGGRCNW